MPLTRPTTPEEAEERLKNAFVLDDFGDVGGEVEDFPIPDKKAFLKTSATSAWAQGVIGSPVSPYQVGWQGQKDGIVRSYFNEKDASGVSDDDLFSKIAEDYKAKDALAEAARNAAARGESWLGKFREVEQTMPNVAGGRQSSYLGLAREVHDSFRSKILPYQSIIRSVAEKAMSIETSPEGMDWSGMAQELIQVPKESRPFVLEAISRQAAANIDANAAERMGKEFARGFERFLDTAMSGVESVGESGPGRFLRQSYGFDVDAVTPEQREQRAQFMDLRDDIRDISTGKLAKLEDVRLLGMNISGAARNVPMTIGAFVPYIGPAALLGSFQRETANELRRSNPTMSREDIETIATISAPFQAVTEVVSDRLLFGRLPNLKRLFTTPAFSAGGIAAQLAGRAALGTAIEYAEEFAQGVIPRIVQSLKSDVPDVDWDGYFQDFKDQSPELLATILPLALFGAGVGQATDYRASVQMLYSADEMMAAKIPADEARKIAELAAAGKRPEAESMFRQEFRKAATKGEAPAEMRAAAQRVIAANQAQRQVEEINSTEAANLGVRVFRDAAGWKVETAGGNVINADSAEASRRIRDDIRTASTEYEAETMTAIVDDMVALQPQMRVELRPEVATATSEGIEFTDPVTGKTTKMGDAKSFQNLRDQAEAISGNQYESARLILGDNYFEFGEGIARVFRRARGPEAVPQVITAAHEVIESSFRRGLLAGQWTENDARNAIGSLLPALESGVVKLGKKATAEERLWLDNAKRAVAEGDSNLVREVISEMGVRTWIGRDRDGNKTGLRPGTILRALDAAILQEKSPENVTTFQRLRAWFKAVGAYLKGVVATAKIIRDAERNGTIDDFTGFLDKVLGIDTATREENEVKDGVIDMAFSLAPEMQSRAKPQTIAPVTEMPDGFRLVGPSTFSIQAYQGTPHKFKPETKYRLTDGREVWLVDGEDTIPEGASEIGKAPAGRIRLSKMGTGEGAQAYGWGGYAAENREVGEMYRDTITAAKSEMFKQRDRLQDIIRARDKAQERLDADPQGKYASIEVERIAEFSSEIEALQSQIAAAENARGNLYTLELLPDADEFLDWDKPLSEQSEKVRGALQPYLSNLLQDKEKVRQLAIQKTPKAFAKMPWEASDKMPHTGRLLYDQLAKNGIKAASEYLASLGIPGIRYLDAGSRGDGDGTHNYVIFDENIVRILEENGKPVDSTYSLASSPGGLNEADDGVNMAFSLATRLVSGRISDEQFLGDPSWKSIRDAIENIDPSAKRGVSKKPTNTGTKDAELASLFRSGFTTSANSKEDVRGGEHTVEFRNGRAYKQTHPETFGAKFDPSDPKNLKWGTPLEYLTRWRLFNEIFPGAGVKFEGVVMHPNGALSLKISQPEMKGENPTVEQLKTTLEGAGWKNIGLNTWQKNGITMTDAKTSNFVVQDGLVIPLDVILSGEVKAGSTFSLSPNIPDEERITPENKVALSINGKPAADIFAEVKKRHGVTRSIYEAGYVLPDGTMLDFSGRADAGGFTQGADLVFRAQGRDYMKDQRGVDHREIEWQDMPEYKEIWGAMTAFLRLGAVRVDANSGMISMHSRAKITSAQAAALKSIVVAADGAYIDLEDDARNRASMQLDGGKWGKVNGLLTRWANGETPEFDGVTFSLSPQSGIDIVSDTLESWQDVFDKAAKRNPARAMAIRDLAQQRINRLGEMWAADRWTAKGDKIRAVVEKRTKGSLDDEQAMREALRYQELLDAGMDTLTTETLMAYSEGVGTLEDDPLIAKMLNDNGKMMSKSTAERQGLPIKDLYDDAVWLPPQFYAKGGGIMPDVMANNLGFDTASEMWAALESSIKSHRSAKEGYAKSEAAVKAVEQQAREQAKAEAAEWRQEADDMQADDWSPRESLVRDMRVLNVALSAFPPEVRAKVTGGSMVKLAGLATERARYKAIKKALDRAITETEVFMKKEYTAQVKAVFARYEPDAKSGEKPKGKLGPDVQEIYDAAKAALGLTAEQTQAELARLDSLIAADGITPEQELNLIRQRGLVELLGDWKNANSGRMSAALEALEDTLSEGWASWKLRQILIREGREESRKELRSATKKKGLGKERDAMRDESATTLGKASSALLNLSSFSDVMKYAFGAVNKAKEFISRERIASNAYEDAIQLIGDRVQDFFTAMGGGSVIAGERIRYDLAHSRVKVGSGESERNLTQMQGIQALLMWQQEDGRRHMEGPKDESGKPIEGKWSYDEAWIADLESKLTPEAKSVKLFLQQLYSEEWAPLNAIYREIHGINLPRHELYAPLTVKPQQAKQGEMVDPVSGAAITGSILTPGSLRSRNRTAQAEPDFRDALAVFLGHSKQMEHWKNYYQLAVDLSAVLGNREVMNAVEASIGGEGVTVLRKWIDAIAQGGFRDAAAQMEISQIMSRVAGRAATVALLGRVSTLLVQSTQIAAASVRMPVGAYLKRLGKLTTGNLSWGDAIKSDFIQRRIKQAPPIIRQAMNDLGTASRPNAITAAVRYLGNLLSGADGLFTGGTYAILLDWHRAQGAKMGLEGAELNAYAHDMAVTITEEVAQPVRMANRSLMEITSTNPLAKVSWAYSSEARQKIALFFWAAKTAKADPAKFGKTAFLTFIVGGLVSQVLKNLWREAKGDDDEKKWSVERLTTATLAGPLHGIPMASEIMGNPGQLSSIAWSKAALEDVFTGDADMHDVQTLLSVSGYFNDNLAGIGALGNLGFDFAKIIKAATEDD